MDVMKILKSLEEALYEVITWLVFFPRTLWMVVFHPSKMMAYSDDELGQKPEEQYTDTLSPPLFLLLTLLLIHLVEIIVIPTAGPNGLAVNTPRLMKTHESLLAFRAVAFAIFPLLMACKLLRGKRIPLDRRTLKPPFYAQCYAAAPFAAVVSGSTIVQRAGFDAAGLGMLLCAYAWYGVVQTRWFVHDLQVSRLRAIWLALAGTMQGTFVGFGIVLLLKLTE